jgi:hypothetical protein
MTLPFSNHNLFLFGKFAFLIFLTSLSTKGKLGSSHSIACQ